MAIYLDTPEPSDALKRAHEFFVAFEHRVANQRVFEMVKHGHQLSTDSSRLPRLVQGETIREGVQRG